MNEFIKVSAHINKLLGDFVNYFDHTSLSRTEREQMLDMSNYLHHRLLDDSDLTAYDEHLELAKRAYRRMLLKMNSPQLVEDILFCGSSELTWEETSRSLSNLYRLNLHSREIYAFYYLHEVNNHLYIDSPLPMHKTVNV